MDLITLLALNGDPNAYCEACHIQPLFLDILLFLVEHRDMKRLLIFSCNIQAR